MRPLVATSCLFATVVVHAYHAEMWVYHHLFLAVLVLSLVAHGTRDPWIMPVDRVVAHGAFLFILSEGLSIENPGDLWIAVFPCVVLALWAAESVYPRRAREIHVFLHGVSVVGLHCFLSVLYPTEPLLERWGL